MINVVLIPAYKPTSDILTLLTDLIKLGLNHVVVVRDGGGDEFNDLFNQIKTINGVHVVEHKYNLGKGRALKSGFNYIANNFDNANVITADADMQHLPVDIKKVADALLENPNKIVLGSRNFNEKDVPARSRLGNKLTANIFKFLIGININDTQTGLRGIPFSLLCNSIRTSGEKYEYESNFLIKTKEWQVGIVEVPITTVYLDDNNSSHFNMLLDSIKIYFVLLRYVFASFSSFILDYTLFLLLFSNTDSLLIATIGSRSISMLYNFFINKKMVFHHHDSFIIPFIKYLLLACFSMASSYFILNMIQNYHNLSIPFFKIVVESVLFFLNFFIQQIFVFKTKKN